MVLAWAMKSMAGTGVFKLNRRIVNALILGTVRAARSAITLYLISAKIEYCKIGRMVKKIDDTAADNR